MKRIIVCFLLSLTASNILPAQDTLTFYYDDKWNEITDKDDAAFYRKAFIDNNVWTVRDYYKSDKIQMKGAYKSKKFTVKQGHFVYYYENGQKQSEGDFINDKEVGLWTRWYENGQKKSEGNYQADNPESYWKYWYDSGEVKAEGKYIYDNKDSVWNYWYKNGKMESYEIFKNGLIYAAKQYYKNGVLYYSGNYMNGARQGTWKYLNIDGRIYFSGNYTNGVREGEWVRAFQTGEMKVLYNKGVIKNKQYGGMVRKNRNDTQ